jgi:hypothetical protein
MQKLAVLMVALACIVSSSAMAQNNKPNKTAGAVAGSQAARCCAQYGGVWNNSTQLCSGLYGRGSVPYMKCAGRL